MNFTFRVDNFTLALLSGKEIPEECCNNITKCTNDILFRDVLYNTSQEIIFMFIFLLYLVIVVAVLFNFYSVRKLQRNKIQLKKIIIINTIVLISALSNWYIIFLIGYNCEIVGLIYSSDGILEMFHSNVPLQLYTMCDSIKILIFHYAMLYASYIWY